MNTKNILIIEDDLDFANILKDQLSEEGHQVFIIDELRQLSTSIAKYDINFIVSDIMLEESMGLDILKMMKLKNVTIPIVFMTGFDGIRGLSEAMGDEAVIDVLVKPFKIEGLLKLISSS